MDYSIYGLELFWEPWALPWILQGIFHPRNLHSGEGDMQQLSELIKLKYEAMNRSLRIMKTYDVTKAEHWVTLDQIIVGGGGCVSEELFKVKSEWQEWDSLVKIRVLKAEVLKEEQQLKGTKMSQSGWRRRGQGWRKWGSRHWEEPSGKVRNDLVNQGQGLLLHSRCSGC